MVYWRRPANESPLRNSLEVGFCTLVSFFSKNTPENVELSEFVFSLHLLIIFILYASMWSHYMFSLFCQKEPTERTPFGELFGRWRGRRLRPRPDRMPDSEICHNMNKWESFFSSSDEKKICESKYWPQASEKPNQAEHFDNPGASKNKMAAGGEKKHCLMAFWLFFISGESQD